MIANKDIRKSLLSHTAGGRVNWHTLSRLFGKPHSNALKKKCTQLDPEIYPEEIISPEYKELHTRMSIAGR